MKTDKKTKKMSRNFLVNSISISLTNEPRAVMGQLPLRNKWNWYHRFDDPAGAWEELDFNSVGQHDKLEERKDLGTKATIYGITASSITYAGVIIGFTILGFEAAKLRELQRELYVNVANAARIVTDIDNSL